MRADDVRAAVRGGRDRRTRRRARSFPGAADPRAAVLSRVAPVRYGRRVLPPCTPTVWALAYSIVRARCGDASPLADDRHNRVARYVLAQHAGMPDYLRLPFAALTVVFGLSALALTGRTFRALPHERRWRVVEAWRRLPVSFARDLLRFYEGLVVFAWFTVEHGGDLD